MPKRWAAGWIGRASITGAQSLRDGSALPFCHDFDHEWARRPAARAAVRTADRRKTDVYASCCSAALNSALPKGLCNVPLTFNL